jgi:hypothetical protein
MSQDCEWKFPEFPLQRLESRQQPQPHFHYQSQARFNQTQPQVQLPYWSNNGSGYPGFQHPASQPAVGNCGWTQDTLPWTSIETPQNVDPASSVTSFSCLFSAFSSHPSPQSSLQSTPSLPCIDPRLTAPSESSMDEVIARLREAIDSERRNVDALLGMLSNGWCRSKRAEQNLQGWSFV